jgi:tripartite ATP-independent transporter DctM subunit
VETAALAGLVLVLGMTVLILIGAPISTAVGLPSVLAMFVVVGAENGSLTSAQQMFRGINSFALLAIPFFVLAGVIMSRGGIALRLINASKVMVGRVPGSLPQTTVAANTLFGAVSGSSIAAAASIGTVMAPLEAEEGYDRDFSAAVNVASAPGGMLVPPSNLMIVYSLVSGTSVAALFVAGYLPGILWAVACAIVVWLHVRKRPELRETQRVGFRESVRIILAALPSLFLVVVVIVGILAGFFTATESACIAVFYSAILSAFYRTIKLKDVPGILLESTRITAVVMFLIAVSTIMSFVMSFAKIPDLVADAMFAFSDNPVVLLLVIAFVLLAFGTFMDATPAVLIFTPIFLPIVTSFGVDPIHFGIMMIFNVSIGMITPPVGTVLSVGAQVANRPIEGVIRRLNPFLVALVVCMIVVIFTPGLSLWLPELFGLMP